MAFWGINLAAESLLHDLENLERFLSEFKSFLEKEARQEPEKNLFVIIFKGQAKARVQRALGALTSALEACQSMKKKETKLLQSEVTILRKKRKPKPGWTSTELNSDFEFIAELRKDGEQLKSDFLELHEALLMDMHDAKEDPNEQVNKKARFILRLEKIFYEILNREFTDLNAEEAELNRLRNEIDTPKV